MLALHVRVAAQFGDNGLHRAPEKLAACTYVEFVAARSCIAKKTGMNKRNLFCAWCHCSTALTTTVRRHTPRIRSTEVTDGAVFTLVAYETRYYCSFIGNRFPVYKISLSLSTIADCFILDRTMAELRKEWIGAGFPALTVQGYSEGGVWENTGMWA